MLEKIRNLFRKHRNGSDVESKDNVGTACRTAETSEGKARSGRKHRKILKTKMARRAAFAVGCLLAAVVGVSGAVVGKNVTASASGSWTITYAGGGSTGGTQPAGSTISYGTEYTFKDNTYTKTGYSFAGWKLTTTISGTTYTYYRKDSSHQGWYTSSSVPSGYSLYLPTGSNYHYTFGVSSGTYGYTCGDVTIPNGMAVTATAQWTANSYTITFNANGGTRSGSSTKTVTYNSVVSKTNTTATREGYTFLGWYTGTGSSAYKVFDASGNVVKSVSGYTDSSGKWIKAGNATLYAHWKADTVTITFDPGTGSGSTKTQTVTAGTATALTSVSALGYSKTGYSFYRWRKGTTSTYYANQASVTITAAMTLTAQWTANTYTVTLYNGSTKYLAYTMTYDSTTFTSGTSSNGITTVGTGVSKTGYDFNGWWNSSSGGTRVFTATGAKDTSATSYWSSSKWHYAGNVNLYAQWTPHTYTVNYNANGGTGTVTSQTCSYGTTYYYRANSYSRAGYAFLGWYMKDNSTGKFLYKNASGTGTAWYTEGSEPTGYTKAIYTAGSSFSNLTSTDGATITMYAAWRNNNAGWDNTNIIEDTEMFKSDTALVGGDGTKYQKYLWNSTYANIDDAEDDPGYFTKK